ncbi:hypothetical protein [Microtetraspora sp. NBRC 16547]|uniref:hypothetical protein n=1 Tax=Microtetraspora sp. NBRC 16547 TaxID=3030993 RepID=UPI0024A09211|nr:hypothetical protein [Microtetraspora sp. NBRC 16547]GLX01792.1 hypothetical protein Misp02_58780 [Microtetraspora sp. NBRC 16547]
MRIDEALLNEAKAFAARNGRTLNSVMEEALRQLMNRSEQIASRPRVDLPVFCGELGYTPRMQAILAAGHTFEEAVDALWLEEQLETLEGVRRDDAR